MKEAAGHLAATGDLEGAGGGGAKKMVATGSGADPRLTSFRVGREEADLRVPTRRCSRMGGSQISDLGAASWSSADSTECSRHTATGFDAPAADVGAQLDTNSLGGSRRRRLLLDSTDPDRPRGSRRRRVRCQGRRQHVAERQAWSSGGHDDDEEEEEEIKYVGPTTTGI